MANWKDALISRAREAASAGDGVVVLTMTNWGYADFAINLVACWRRLQVHNHLLVTIDELSSDYFQQVASHSHESEFQLRCVPLLRFEEAQLEVFSEAGEAFGTLGFRAICNVKAWLVRELLHAGVDVLWTDTDIVWLTDPLPDVLATPRSRSRRPASFHAVRDRIPFHLSEADGLLLHWRVEGPVSDIDGSPSHKGGDGDLDPDFVFQSDDDGVCAGFYLARSTDRSIRYMDQVMSYLNPAIDDQLAMRRLLHGADCPLRSVAVLPRLHYPNGSVYFQHKLPQRRQIQPIIVHNNCVIGHDHKKRRFVQFALWFVTPAQARSVAGAGPGTERRPATKIQLRRICHLKGHSAPVSGLDFVPAEASKASDLLSVSYDRSLRRWALRATANGTTKSQGIAQPTSIHYVHLRGGPFQVTTAADSSSDCMVFIAGHDCTASLRTVPIDGGLAVGTTKLAGPHVQSGESTSGSIAEQPALRVFRGHSAPLNDLCVDRSGTTLFTASDDETAASWDIASGRRIRWFVGHTGWVTCCQTHGNSVLFTGSNDRTARAWEVASGRCMQVYKTDGWVRCVLPLSVAAYGKDGSSELLLYAGDVTGHVYCWNARSGEMLSKTDIGSGVNCVQFFELTDNGGVILLGLESGSLAALPVPTGNTAADQMSVSIVKTGHEPFSIRSLRTHAGWIASGSDDGTISIWMMAE